MPDITLALTLAFPNGKPVIQPHWVAGDVLQRQDTSPQLALERTPALPEGDTSHALLTKRYLHTDREENHLQAQQMFLRAHQQ